jgi:hypothetical protein
MPIRILISNMAPVSTLFILRHPHCHFYFPPPADLTGTHFPWTSVHFYCLKILTRSVPDAPPLYRLPLGLQTLIVTVGDAVVVVSHAW